MRGFILIAVSIGIMASSQTSVACGKKEYAELKDMEESELVATYCQAEQSLAMSKEFADIYRRISESDYKYHRDNIYSCSELVSKSKTAYKAKFNKLPECPAAPPTGTP